MNEASRIEKNKRIQQTLRETKLRRKSQSCSVYKVKIDESSLNKRQREALKMIFVEPKWIYNDILNHLQQKNSLDSYDSSKKSVQILNKDKQFELRQLRFIGSQMKQSIVSQIKSSLRSLKSLRSKNIQKTGRLNYISEYKSINLKKYENCYKFHSQNKIKIQNVPGLIRIRGAQQFLNIDNIEFANAKILNTKSGYYIAITTYREKNDINSCISSDSCSKNLHMHDENQKYLPEIGIDFGIKTSITTSTGTKYNVLIEESERIKKLQRSLNRKQKRSNNQYKTRLKLNKAYEKLNNLFLKYFHLCFRVLSIDESK